MCYKNITINVEINVDKCIENVPHGLYNGFWRALHMEKETKSYSMSIRVSQDELEKLKMAARLEAYSSYSEFVRRTALIEANEVIKRGGLEKRR